MTDVVMKMMTYGQPSASIRLSLATAPWICRRSTPCLPCPGPSWEACAGEGGWMVFLVLRWILSMATMRWTLCKDKHPPLSPSCKPSTWSGSSTVEPTSAFPLHIYQAQEILAVWAQHKQTHQDNHWSWLGCALRKTLVNQKETKKRNETWSRIKRSYWQML